ncbi:protein kinase, putative [Leishmania tarentolae]|uniref:Protein kinase, putative n=1 Tax=Leishmania tarentolae TaxID=5689 RepID=A0A640K7I7_LEITA|nr:protein kinase, putative [Leishmania tarentolae]
MQESSTLIFDVPDAFQVESIIGQGAYGAVCKAVFCDDQIAVKKIPHYSRGEDTARRVLREIEILQNLQFCEQVVGCRLFFRPKSGEKDLYVAMDYIPADLSSVIKNGAITLDESVVRYITCQLLLALRALHRCNVLHRDVSTRNILIHYNSQVFLCDFGLSRFFDPDEQLSFGVVTQWYRAPEIILDAAYSYASDVWSVGVILGELLLRRHLFPGKSNDSANQLQLIFHLVGTPSKDIFDADRSFGRASQNAKNYALAYIERRPCPSTVVNLLSTSPVLHHSVVTAGPPQAVQLAEQLLQFDPAKRPSADEALRHPWFDPCRAFIDEVVQHQDEEEIPVFTQTQNMNVEELVRRIEEVVPVFSEDLLVEDDGGAAVGSA